MKYLLGIAGLGFVIWVASDLLDALVGPIPIVFYMTASYHLLAGLGFTGIYLAQKPQAGMVSLIATVLIITSYLALVPFPLAVMSSGQAPSELVQAQPLWAFPAGANFFGYLLFGASLLGKSTTSRYIGIAVILSIVAFAAGMRIESAFVTLLLNLPLATVMLLIVFSSYRSSQEQDS